MSRIQYIPERVPKLTTYRVAARMRDGELAVFEVDVGQGNWRKALAVAKTYPGVRNVIVRIK